MKLKRVIIGNFRAYRDLTPIDIEDLTTFVGRNDAGKSTILEALEIFFNHEMVKLEQDDLPVGSRSKMVVIGCVFTLAPDTAIILDETANTTLRGEYLLNGDGDLEIHKGFDLGAAKIKESICAIAQHPSNPKACDLLSLKLNELKKRLEELKIPIEKIDIRSKPQMRAAIWTATPELNLTRTEVPLDKEDSRAIWDKIEQWMPVYALFRSDRPSTDDDSEVQDPMKIAVREALKDAQELLDEIMARVQVKTTYLAKKTLEKLKEIAPDLASNLAPQFKASPKWDQLFKMSLTGDDDIPINKRGSGARRLILLSFFRAAAESKRTEQNAAALIYAIEEPETSQHPIQQKLLMDAFRELAEENCQILLTTHNPALASLVPISGIRYVRKEEDHTTVSVGAGILQTVAAELGVLSDHRIRVLVGVEGPNDCNFFIHISRMLNAVDPRIPSLSDDPKIALYHLGGSNLLQWVQGNYLRELHRPEIHIYDRGMDQPPKFTRVVAEVCARGDGSYATLTSKREIENYLHPQAIQQVFGINVQFGDDDNLPSMISGIVHNNAPDHNVPWDQLEEKKQKEKIMRTKYRLNEEVASKMTYAMLQERDPQGELQEWLRRIAAHCA